MSSPFIGQIALFPFETAPQGWALCDGRVLNVKDNPVLFSIISDRWGGDSVTTFALPDFRGRALCGAMTASEPLTSGCYCACDVGTFTGEEQVYVPSSCIPPHTHPLYCSSNRGTTNNPTGMQFAVGAAGSPQQPVVANFYSTVSSAVQLGVNAELVNIAGGLQPHNNMQPYIALNFFIAVQGQVPPHS